MKECGVRVEGVKGCAVRVEDVKGCGVRVESAMVQHDLLGHPQINEEDLLFEHQD